MIARGNTNTKKIVKSELEFRKREIVPAIKK